MHTKTLFLTLGIVIGIVCGQMSVYGSEVALAAGLLIGLQGALGITQMVRTRIYDTKKKEGQPSFFFVSSLTLCIALGVMIGIVRVQFVEEKRVVVCDTPCTRVGRVVSPSKFVHEYQTIVLRIDEGVPAYDVLVRLPRYPIYSVGDRVSVTGIVRTPSTAFPHESQRLFDYGAYLRTQHIGSEMFYPAITTLNDRDQSHTFVEVLQSYKEGARKLLSYYVTDPESSLASGVLIGDDGMSSELKNTFRAAGVSHIVVLSGFNIAILVIFIFWITYFLPLTLRVVFAFSVITLFVLTVGGEASLIRASIMTGVSLMALLVGRGYAARQALLVSLVCILLYSPENVLYDVSLHLSFLATAGIVYVAPILESVVTSRVGTSFRSLLITTLATYIATMPYVLYMFGSVSLYSLVANSIIVPMVPLLMLLSGATVVTGLISDTLALLFGYATSCIGHTIIVLARVFETLPFSHLEMHSSFTTMLVLYVSGAIILIVTRNRSMVLQKNETLRTHTNETVSEVMPY